MCGSFRNLPQITSCLETYLESRLKWSRFSWSEDEGLQPYVVSTPSPSGRYFLLSNCPALISSCSSYLSCMFGGLPHMCETWERIPISCWEAKDPYSFTPTSCFLAKPKACDLGSGNPASFPMSLNQEHVTVWGWLRSFSSQQQGHMAWTLLVLRCVVWFQLPSLLELSFSDCFWNLVV